MSRNYDWSPLGFYSDPVPGVPSDLRTQVAKYKQIAADIVSDTARNVVVVDDDGTEVYQTPISGEDKT